MFTDSIYGNLELLQMLISDMPPERRHNAKKAAIAIERVFDGLRKEYPKDPGVALGAALAIYTLANRMVEQQEEGDKSSPLIQLVS